MNNSSAFSSATQQDLAAIQAAAESSDYFYEQVWFLCNSIGPRLSGSPQAAAAVEYVGKQMRDLGLEVRLEPVTVRHWVRGREEAQLIRFHGQVPGKKNSKQPKKNCPAICREIAFPFGCRYLMQHATGRGGFRYGTKKGKVERGFCAFGASVGRFVLCRSGIETNPRSVK